MTTRDYVPEKRHANLTPGRALQIARERQELSQSELARRSSIAQSAISRRLFAHARQTAR